MNIVHEGGWMVDASTYDERLASACTEGVRNTRIPIVASD